MKKYLTVAAGLFAGATQMLVAAPSIGANVDNPVIAPSVVVARQPVYLQARHVYIQQQYEIDLRERQLRAIAWGV